MGIFKSEEEQKQEALYQEAVRKIIVFPGTVPDYERFIGHEVEMIDTNRENKGVYVTHNGSITKIRDKELRNYLIDQNLEAVLTQTFYPFVGEIMFYGLPVRRKIRK